MNWTYYKDEDGDLWRVDYEHNVCYIMERSYEKYYWDDEAPWNTSFIKKYQMVKLTEEEMFLELV